jgi:ribosome-associated protein
MDIRKLQRAIVDGLEDVKAHDIVVLNTEHLSPLFERVIIASGTSNRQTRALASSVRETVKARGLPLLRTEGEDNGEWIVVDCGAAVAHIMQPSIRDYYHLEEIWGGKPVRMKLGAETAPSLPKASEGPPPGPAARTTAAARPPAAKRAAAQGAATAKGSSKKSAAARAAARSAAEKKPAAKKGAVQKTAAQKVAARKGAAKPSAAARSAPRRPAAPRPPSKASKTTKPSRPAKADAGSPSRRRA